MVEGADSDELLRQPAHPYTQLLLSAVPNPQARERHTIEARGEVPSLIDPPPGCLFAARCPQVRPVCRERMPGITHLNDQHWTRCHLYDGEENDRP
jgi:peptide/nickel transport system ATP-binding protein